MSQSRQLAAIMFTDIVGYTALMGNNEQKALDLLEKNRQLQKPIIEEFNGRWIKEIGDGVMASFSTVSDAVNAAVKIQETCTSAKDYQLRIGIDQGEVVFEKDDVLGDAVNIADRIQTVTNPGCIFISETVHHNVRNKTAIKSHFVKEEMLKNVSQPVRMYQVLFTGSEVIKSEAPTTLIEPTNEEFRKQKSEGKGMKSGDLLKFSLSLIAFVTIILTFLQLVGVFNKHPTSNLVIKAVSEPRANDVMFTKFVITNRGDATAKNIVGTYVTFMSGNLDRHPNDKIVENPVTNQATITFKQDSLEPFDSIVRASDFPVEEYNKFNRSLPNGHQTSCDSVPALIYFRADGKEYPKCVSGGPY